MPRFAGTRLASFAPYVGSYALLVKAACGRAADGDVPLPHEPHAQVYRRLSLVDRHPPVEACTVCVHDRATLLRPWRPWPWPRVISATNRPPCLRLRAARPAESLRRTQEASAQEVELGAPKHLALEHLQAVDVAFHRALAPG